MHPPALVLIASFVLSPVAPQHVTHQQVLEALREVECSGRDDCPDGDGGRSIGSFQISRAYWQDALRYDPSIGGSYEDCRDRAYAEKTVRAYMKRYVPQAWKNLDVEIIARTHNGGPRGAHKRATIRHWNKVRAVLKRRTPGAVVQRSLPCAKSPDRMLKAQNLALAGDEALLSEGWLLLEVDESRQGDDLNGDGDTEDESVVHVVDLKHSSLPKFLRGDCDGDGGVNISDAVKGLRLCFAGVTVPCAAACDTDGDGNPCTGVTDGVRLLMYLFRDGNPPPPPFPECGTVEGEVDCETPPTSCQ